MPYTEVIIFLEFISNIYDVLLLYFNYISHTFITNTYDH